MIVLLIVAIHSTSIAQDSTTVGLPDGAIARLGKGGINIMRFSPDGTRLLVGSDAGLWIYDVHNGNETPLFNEHTGQVNVLSFSSDGKIFTSGGFENSVIQIWDLEKGILLSSLDLHRISEKTLIISGLSFFDNDKKLIILELKGTVAHWDIENDQVEILTHNIDVKNAVLISDKDNIIAMEDKKNNILFLNAITGRSGVSNTGHHNIYDKSIKNIRVFAFASNRKYLVTDSIGHNVMLWDMETPKPSTTLKGNSARFSAIAISSDNKTLAAGDANNVIKLWDMDTQIEQRELNVHTSGIAALVFSPDGETLASGSHDGTIRFWDYMSGKEINIFTTGHTKWIKKVTFTNDDSILKSINYNGILNEWSLSTHQTMSTRRLAQTGSRDSVAFSHDGSLLVIQENTWNSAFDPFSMGAQSSGSAVKKPKINPVLWDISIDRKIDTSWMDNLGNVNTFLFSNDNKNIFSVINDKGIISWSINTGKVLFKQNIEFAPMNELKISPNGNLLVLCQNIKNIIVWNLTTQQEIILPVLEYPRTVAFSSDGTLLAIGFQKSIVLWHITPDGLDEGNTLETDILVKFLNFSRDNKTLVYLSLIDFQEYIQLLDVQSGNEICTLSGHTERITSLSFSHDGKILASASWDGTIMLWDWEEITSKNKINRGN